MVNENLELFIYGLCAAAGAGLLIALLALVAAQKARRRLRNFESSLTGLEQAMKSAANIFAESDIRMNAACEQISQLAVRQGTLDAATGQAGFKQAIALSRRGASLRELMDTCGVSQGEARLIQTMYGVRDAASAGERGDAATALAS
jgi:hypothetical protein